MPKNSSAKKQDARRVSSQSHEINYTGRKVAKKAGASAKAGKTAVKRAKKQSSAVSRPKVERRAVKLSKSR